MRVLVADQNVTVRSQILRLVADPDLQVVCASDGSQAWEFLSQGSPPRIVLVDWLLPKIRGLDLCHQIRTRGFSSYTYVILMGSRPDRADMLAAFNAGADDYISKPIDSDELLARIAVGKRLLLGEEKLSSVIVGWRAMLDCLPLGVASLGSRGQVVRANKVFLELLGYQVGDLLGKTLAQIVLHDPKDIAQLMGSIRQSHEFDRAEMEMTRQDGSTLKLIVWGRAVRNIDNMVYQIITGMP